MPRKYERKVLTGDGFSSWLKHPFGQPKAKVVGLKGHGPPLLAGDLMSMLGLPSIGMTAMPLEGIFNSVMGPGAFTNLRNTGTKMLLDNVLKGVVGKGRKVGGLKKLPFGHKFTGVPIFPNRSLVGLKQMISKILTYVPRVALDDYLADYNETAGDIQFIQGHIDTFPLQTVLTLYDDFTPLYEHFYEDIRPHLDYENPLTVQVPPTGSGRKGKNGRPQKTSCMCGGAGGTLVGGAWYDCLPCLRRRTRTVALAPALPERLSDQQLSPLGKLRIGNYLVPTVEPTDRQLAHLDHETSPGIRVPALSRPSLSAAKSYSTRQDASRLARELDEILNPTYTTMEGINQPSGSGRKPCKHKHPNKCKCPKMHGAGIFDAVGDYAKAWDLPGTGQKLANSALEILMKRALAGGAQPYNAPVMIGGRWTDYINPAWYFKKTMQKVVEPVLHATKLDKVVNAIPGVNMVAALTGATKPAGAGRGRRRGGAGLVDDLEGGAIPNFNNMSVAKLRQIYKALDDRPQPKGKAELIESISPFFDSGDTPAQHRANIKKDVSAATKALRKMQAPKDAAYYRQRYARRKAAKEQEEHVKEI